MGESLEKEPLFSIILPIYNVEEYLEECVNSVLSQDCSDYEIVLVDDGSLDKSGAICDRLQKEHDCIRAYHKVNGGLSSARNYGTERALGKYIYYLDSDDFIAQGALSTFRELIEKKNYPEVILENGQYYYNGEKQTKVVKFTGGEDFGYLTGAEALHKLIKGQPLHAAFGKCFKRSFWNENGFRFTEGLTSEDLDIIYKVIYKADKVAMTSEPFYVYRENREGSIMNKFKEKNMRDLFAIFDGWEEFFEKNNCDELTINGMRRLFGDVYYDFVICKLGVVESADMEKLYEDSKKYISYLEYTRRKYIFSLYKAFGLEKIVRRVRWIARFDALLSYLSC